MKKWLLFSLLLTMGLLVACNTNIEGAGDSSAETSNSTNQLSPEEIEQASSLLLTGAEQMNLRQKLIGFYGDEESFREHGFVYIDTKQNNRGVIGIKGLTSKKTEELKEVIYQDFTKKEVEIIKAEYTTEELSLIKDDIWQYLSSINVRDDIEADVKSRHLTLYISLKEQKIKMEVSPITEEQLQKLKEKFGDVLVVDVKG